MKPFALFLLLISLLACQNKDKDSVVGKWTLSGENQSDTGFTLDKEGIASAFPAGDIDYQTWEMQGDNLLLHGRKQQNGSTSPYDHTLKVISIKDNTLIVETEDGQTLTYTKTLDSAEENEEECYAYMTAKDTVYLHISRKNRNITGDLTYKLYEKDSNHGSLDGRVKGDTLLAEYSFSAEGRSSVREVIFLKKGDTYVEGFGPVNDKEGKTVFQDHKNITFINGITLSKTNCTK
ncbi:lipocalin family protein [Siphonobacter sp. SORGH_AS_0500]|uniref:lipocalin family protein n=1 Tax=Siphonobacter sp. SORGH_AS_0500 TaxID=1864824 RepID=UPI00285938AA|nr:lipocalin family protein [Siphonobacter sp. SORGH_AS_0500]MDR6194844.1 hypothetical protein [Siphonobacter sp. SORGH_AS_0500]